MARQATRERSAPPEIDPKLIKLEREIGSITDHIRNHRQAVVEKRSAIARFFMTFRRRFSNGGNRTPAKTVSGPKPTTIPAGPAQQAHEPKMATHAERKVVSKGDGAGRVSALGVFYRFVLARSPFAE